MAATDTKAGRPRKHPLPAPVTVDDIPTNQAESQELKNTIERAAGLIEQKMAVLAQIQEARILAHLLINNGSGNREQVKWVREHLPRKQKKNGSEDTDEE